MFVRISPSQAKRCGMLLSLMVSIPDLYGSVGLDALALFQNVPCGQNLDCFCLMGFLPSGLINFLFGCKSSVIIVGCSAVFADGSIFYLIQHQRHVAILLLKCQLKLHHNLSHRWPILRFIMQASFHNPYICFQAAR